MGRGACTQVGQRKIFLNGHVGGCAFEGILEQVADDLAALVLRLKGDVLPAQHDAALVGDEPAGDGIEQGGLSRAVGTHDGGKVPGFHVQAHSVQRHLFVHGAGVEGLMQVVQLQHFHLTFPPSRPRRGGHGRHVCAFQRQNAPGWLASKWPRPQ